MLFLYNDNLKEEQFQPLFKYEQKYNYSYTYSNIIIDGLSLCDIW